MANKSDIVSLIQKMAQGLPEIPTRPGGPKAPANPAPNPAPGPFGGGKPSGHGGGGAFEIPQKNRPSAPATGGGSKSSTDIMAMQHALQDLAADVSKQINLPQMVSGNDMEKEEAKSRDAFNTFITKNYMRNSSVPGVEYDPDPRVKQMRDKEKSQDDPTRMSVVMDTMNRVGNPKKGEQFVDGQWGPRTNAAIRDVFAFATGLFQFVNDINSLKPNSIQLRSYNPEALKELGKWATPDNSLTPEQKAEAAPTITQNVKSIQTMYNEVKTKFLQHPAYRQFIESDVPYETYKSTTITPQQIEALKKGFPKGVPVQLEDFNQLYVPVESLLSPTALQKWFEANVSPETASKNQLTMSTVLDKIQEQQSQVLGTKDPNQSNLLTQHPSKDPGY